jgi:hypothetical protein
VNKEKMNDTVKLVTRKAVFKAICFEQLEKKIVEQLVSAMDFESLKAKAVEKILRNMALLISQLEGLMESVGDDLNV